MKERIDVFHDTQNRLWQDERLYRLTARAVDSTRVFPENYSVTRVCRQYRTVISVKGEHALDAARELTGRCRRTAVLNAGNAVNPGGGAAWGESGLEEDLCCCTNLYPCLMQPEAMMQFYAYNNECGFRYSDRVLYSEDVTVLKKPGETPQWTDEWFQIDVLTCPAPNLNGTESGRLKNPEAFFARRIHNILSVAEACGATGLVLGAFGCGSYGNSPETVAAAFKKELVDGSFAGCFREVIFAIPADRIREWNTLEVFRRTFAPETVNPFLGKRISILGDGISTFSGYHPEYCPVYYDVNRALGTGVYSVEETWWMQAVRRFGAKLWVNNSCLGSSVSGESFLSGCQSLRTRGLHRMGMAPDAVWIYMGMEDYIRGVPPEGTARREEASPGHYFRSSYRQMLEGIREMYPNAEVYCGTLCLGSPGNRGMLADRLYGVELETYNEIIRECAESFGYAVVELGDEGAGFGSADGMYPDAFGMTQLADAWCAGLMRLYSPEKPEKNRSLLAAGLLTGAAVALVVLLAALAALCLQ